VTATTTIRVIQIGVGTVGGEVVRQLYAGRERWRRDFGLDVVLSALVGRAGALLPRGDALALDVAEAALERRRRGGSLAAVAGTTEATPAEAIERVVGMGSTVVIDSAVGEQTAEIDVLALERGAGVVLSNKAPLTLPWASPVCQSLWRAVGLDGRLRYEATCGAGLPVMSTLRALLDTGDEPREILAAVSGTLGAIFSEIESGRSFSIAVHAAVERGYTEPDPRDDLNGLDVARKALILARTIGRTDDLVDVAVENLVPSSLSADSGVSVAAFLEQTTDLDDVFARRAAAARETGCALRYAADVTPTGTLAAGVRSVPTASVLGALRGPENAVSIRTARYDVHPLGVSGPGAGPAVTAAGMIADLLALATGPLRATTA
jgi:homoserine dehydrogenase